MIENGMESTVLFHRTKLVSTSRLYSDHLSEREHEGSNERENPFRLMSERSHRNADNMYVADKITPKVGSGRRLRNVVGYDVRGKTVNTANLPNYISQHFIDAVWNRYD